MATHASSLSTTSTSTAPTWQPRLGAVAAGVVVNLVYVLIVTKAVGYELKIPEAFGQPAAPVQIGAVIGASIVAPLIGWGILALLEKVVPQRAALIWGILAVVVLVVGLPFNGAGITAKDQVLLGVMHLIVGAIVIPTFVLTSLRKR
jgi:hypothetical protein